MSEHEDFKAWLKTWSLPGNTSREDAMYAAWQARAARTAPAEPVAIANKGQGAFWVKWTDAAKDLFGPGIKLYTAPGALQAEVQRLTKQIEEGLPRLMQQCHDLRADRDALKADAERFKYVLSQIPANLGEVFCQCLTATDDDIIEAIDAARTAKPEVKS